MDTAATTESLTETPAPAKWRQTIAVDFDGVIHSYASGWQGADVIPDPPVDGAIAWLNELAVVADVVILTTRAETDEGRRAVMEWLMFHGVDVELEHPLAVTNVKVPATVYLDDRAIRFRGVFPPIGRLLYSSHPWYKETPPADPKKREQKTKARALYVLGLERKQHRLIVERAMLYRALIVEIFRGAGVGDPDVVDEWLRQNDVSWDKRVELARQAAES